MSRALLVAAGGLLIAWTPALAQGAGPQGALVSAAGIATATVIKPIAVRRISDLDFGIIANSGESGSVIVAPGVSGARYGGSASRGCAADGDCPEPHVSSFEVAGEANRSYAIGVPARVAIAGEALLSGRAQGERAPAPLHLEKISLRSASRPHAGPAGRLGPDGRDRFDLGGTLRISGTISPARYRASIPVIITYN